MKKLKSFLCVGVVITLLSIIISSCSKDESFDFISPQSRSIVQCKTIVEANKILVDYLELDNEQYVLNISAEDVEELGISLDLYEKVQEELQTTNTLIQTLKNDPNTILELTDPKSIQKTRSDWSSPTLYFNPSGILSTNGKKKL